MFQTIEEQVAEGQITPGKAADKLIETFFQGMDTQTKS